MLGATAPRAAEAGTFFWARMFSVPPRDTPFITPNKDFYLVQYDGLPELSVGTWSLTIGGEVKKPVRLTYADFLSRPTTEAMVTLACIDTLPGGSTISNAVWLGLSLKTVLEECGVDPSAQDVVFRAADGYSDSIPLDRVMQGDVLLAHSMNGEALPTAHGFPLRIIAPGLYGIKNVKWLTEIEVVLDDYKGYWQQRGWTDEGRIKTVSRIDSPGHYQEVVGPEVEIRGIAFGGGQPLRGVEVSTNGGKSFEPASVTQAAGRAAWVHWSYLWRVNRPGAYTVLARAVEENGRKQSDEIRQAYPSGATGLHTIVVLVRES
jgi:hypothetical protein